MIHFHLTCFGRLSVLIVEHEVRKTLDHKELLHAVDLRKLKRKLASRPVSQTETRCEVIIEFATSTNMTEL